MSEIKQDHKQMVLLTDNNNIVIEFPESITTFVLSPGQAIDLARSLVQTVKDMADAEVARLHLQKQQVLVQQ